MSPQTVVAASGAGSDGAGSDDDGNDRRSAERGGDQNLARQLLLRRIPIRTLQQTLGNRALTRLLQQTFSTSASPNVRRKCACGGESEGECAECRANGLALQRDATGRDAGSEAPAIVEEGLGAPGATDDNLEQRLAGSKGTGAPLPKPLRSSLESFFGADFSNVEIHTGSEAVEMTSAVGAQAFTHGSDIYFNQGKYAPESAAGKQLLAHELTHTVQQGASAFRHAPSGPSAPSAGGAPKIQGLDIPFFSDYEFDFSLEGLKTAGEIAADKAKKGEVWVKDQVVAAAEYVWDRISSLINAGIKWLKEEFNEIEEFAVSSFADIKGALSGALGVITTPLATLTNAFEAKDAGIVSAAWRLVTTGAKAVAQTIKGVINGILQFGGHISEKLSGFVDSLFGTVDDLLDSTAFGLLPEFLQDEARGLYQTVRNLWTKIRDFWTDFWKRLTDFVRDLTQSIEDFVQKVLSYAIDKAIETVKKIREIYDFVKQFATDPESVIKPILASIAAKIQAEAPGKFREVAQQKMAEAASSKSSQSSSTVVQRSPDGSAATRSTTSIAVIDANVWKVLSEQWATLDIPKMLWDTVVNMFWPPATIRAIGHEFYELWNTDWKNAASELFTPRSPFDDFRGFLHDLWSNLLILLDFPLALWRRLNNVLTLLMGYVTIILILVGLVGGAIVGNVPGALAGATAGAELAWTLGEALFFSFLTAESASAIKAYIDLLTARRTETAKQRDYLQFAASVIGCGVAIVIAILFSLLGGLARQIVGRIRAHGGAPPRELPGAPPRSLPPGPQTPGPKSPGAEPPEPEPGPHPGPGPEPPKPGPEPEPPGPNPPGPLEDLGRKAGFDPATDIEPMPGSSSGRVLRIKGSKPSADEVALAEKVAADGGDDVVLIGRRKGVPDQPGIDGFYRSSGRPIQLKTLSGGAKGQPAKMVTRANEGYENAKNEGFSNVDVEIEAPEMTVDQAKTRWSAVKAIPQVDIPGDGVVTRVRVRCSDGTVDLPVPPGPQPPGPKSPGVEPPGPEPGPQPEPVPPEPERPE